MTYQEIIQNLLVIQNELMKIHTSGADSFILVDTIKGLNSIIQILDEQKKEE